jgi:hypothetical protein
MYLNSWSEETSFSRSAKLSTTSDLILVPLKLIEIHKIFVNLLLYVQYDPVHLQVSILTQTNNIYETIMQMKEL